MRSSGLRRPAGLYRAGTAAEGSSGGEGGGGSGSDFTTEVTAPSFRVVLAPPAGVLAAEVRAATDQDDPNHNELGASSSWGPGQANGWDLALDPPPADLLYYFDSDPDDEEVVIPVAGPLLSDEYQGAILFLGEPGELSVSEWFEIVGDGQVRQLAGAATALGGVQNVALAVRRTDPAAVQLLVAATNRDIAHHLGGMDPGGIGVGDRLLYTGRHPDAGGGNQIRPYRGVYVVIDQGADDERPWKITKAADWAAIADSDDNRVTVSEGWLAGLWRSRVNGDYRDFIREGGTSIELTRIQIRPGGTTLEQNSLQTNEVNAYALNLGGPPPWGGVAFFGPVAGRADLGPVAIPGALPGKTVRKVINLTDNSDAGARFEESTSVEGEIQQIADDVDLSTKAIFFIIDS